MCFITLKKEQNNYSKYSAVASSALLHRFFNSDFVVGGAKRFLAPGRRVP